MRLLVFSNLWPSSEAQTHGSFVQERTLRLRDRIGCELRVIHPLPRYPRMSGDSLAARCSRLPARERIDGIDIEYPRYWHVPRFGTNRQADRMLRGSRATFRRLFEEFRPDVIDAHYLYPDASAAIRLANEVGVPCVATARGSDVNRLPDFVAVRRRLREDLPKAAKLVCVSSALADRLSELSGVERTAIEVIPNGVDLDRFRLGEDDESRIVSLARLLGVKRVDTIIRALALEPRLPDFVSIGGGPERASLEALARELGVEERVRFLGELDREAVARELSRGGVLAFPSAHEGWPNAVMEAMACGLSVVASAVGGIPEIVAEAGTLLEPSATPEAWARALLVASEARLESQEPRHGARARAQEHSWDRCLDRLEGLYASVCGAAA